MSANYPAASHHEKIKEIFPNIFYVQGTVKMGPGVIISRSMVIIREKGELSLINPIRLSEAGEKELQALGEVKNIFKIGSHGMDNLYYVDKFNAKVWSRKEENLPYAIDVEIDEQTQLPFSDATLFKFKNATSPEYPILINREGGILITCDSVQNWTKQDLKVGSFVGGIVTRLLGFMGPAKIGPFWLKTVSPASGPDLSEDFQRLLELDFSHLLSGHGSPLLNDAKTKLREEVARVKFSK